MMNRRGLLLLGNYHAARSRRAENAMPVIGFLGANSPGPHSSNIAAFRQGLSETGSAAAAVAFKP
jgi:hypothetical protein